MLPQEARTGEHTGTAVGHLPWGRGASKHTFQDGSHRGGKHATSPPSVAPMLCISTSATKTQGRVSHQLPAGAPKCAGFTWASPTCQVFLRLRYYYRVVAQSALIVAWLSPGLRHDGRTTSCQLHV